MSTFLHASKDNGDGSLVQKLVDKIKELTGKDVVVLNTSERSFEIKDGPLIIDEIAHRLNTIRLSTVKQQVTSYLPTKQPRRKTGVAQARRDARKRRNRK